MYFDALLCQTRFDLEASYRKSLRDNHKKLRLV